MPLVASIPAFLGTAAGAATVVSAGVGLAGAAYSSSQANKAAGRQIDAQRQATDQTLALQRQQYDTTRADQAPFREGGYAALDQILADYQLGSKAPGAQQAGGYDVAKYISQNPDVAQTAQQLQAQGVIGPNGQWKTAEDWVSQVQLPNAQANGEQRDYPTIANDPNAPAPLTAEQMLQQQIGDEPTYGERPTFSRPGYINPDVSINAFQASPDYQYRLDTGNRNLNAAFGAKGMAGSGAAGKAFIDYGQNTAAAEYGNWRNYVTGQTDKTNAFNSDAFQSDRAYGTGVYDADRGFATSRFDTNRGYQTGRADKRTNDLFNIAGMGQGSTNFVNQQGQTYANNASNAYQTNANNLSDIYGNQADNNASAFGQAIGGVQSAFNAFRGTPGYSGLPALPGSNATQASSYAAAVSPSLYRGPLTTMPQPRF